MNFLPGITLYLCVIALHAGPQQPRPESELKPDWVTFHRAGSTAFNSGRHTEALANFEASLPLAQTPEQNAITLVAIGSSLGELHRDEEAVEQFEKALAAWRNIDPTGSRAADAAAGLANEQRRTRRYTQAERTLREALDAKPRDEASAAALLNTLGSLIYEQARYADARQPLETALRLSPGKGSNRLLALIGLGDVERLSRQYQPSLSHLHEALTLSRELGHDDWEALVLQGLGITYSEMGDTARAEPLLRRALIQFEVANGGLMHYAATLLSLGTLYAQEGKPALAEDAFNRALKASEGSAGDDALSAQALEALALLLARENRFEEAAEHAKRSFQIAEAGFGQASPSVASALGAIAFVEQKSGDFHAAEQHFGQALEMLRENGFDDSDASFLLKTQYASILRKLHRRAEAKDLEAPVKAFRSPARPAR